MSEKFDLRRRYFLRMYTHRFLAEDIYTRFDEFFKIEVTRPITESSFMQMYRDFSYEITNVRETPLGRMSLASYERIKGALSVEGASINVDLDKFANTDTMAKDLLNELINAEIYRYIIYILQDKKLSLDSLKEYANNIMTQDSQRIFKKFLTRVYLYLEDIIMADFSEVYLYNEIDDLAAKQKIINNTMTNFEGIDKINLDDTLLNDLDITKNAFENEFNSDSVQSLLDDLKDDLLSLDSNFGKFIKMDTLILNFKILEADQQTEISLTPKSSVSDLDNASLYHFTLGVLDGIAAIVIIKLFMKQKSSKKTRILNHLKKYGKNARPSYLSSLKLLHGFVENNAHMNIIFMVYIAYHLGLTRPEAWKLSEALCLNNKVTFNKHFNEFYQSIFPNHQYIR